MTYRLATWLPDVLRAAGITVTEVPGWQSRGLGLDRSDPGTFDPAAVVWHHDASAVGNSPGVVAFMLRNFATGAAQCWVDRQGRWHILAAGRSAHAGVVLRGMPDNSTSIGVETDHTTGEDWPAAQLDSLRKGTAAILAHLDKSANGLHMHKTICSPIGRKIDPDGLALAFERATVAKLIDAMSTAPVVSVAKMRDAFEHPKRAVHPHQVRRVQRALGMNLRNGKWGVWTRLRHRQRFGRPDPTKATLRALGRGRFTVTD